ncbi:MAG: diguanylate cyclase [Bacilli bacterium]|nr:diguanylate cyclase [Bacilli bacterium]
MKKIKFPILVKTIIMILTFAFAITEVAMTFFTVTSSRSNKNQYKVTATDISTLVAETIDVDLYKSIKNDILSIYNDNFDKVVNSESEDVDRIIEYLKLFKSVYQSDNYNKLLKYLGSLFDSIQNNIDCIYLVFLDTVNKNFIYAVDSSITPYNPTGTEETYDLGYPGTVDILYEENYFLIDDPTRGFPAYITSTSAYGWLVTAGAPIYDGDEVVGYAMVDISLSEMKKQQANNITMLFLYLTASSLSICFVGMLVVYFILIRPLKILTDASIAYDSRTPEEMHEIFKKISINTKDEIQELAESMKQMESDINNKIKELIATNKELTDAQKEVHEITELANKDALTGVRNKGAYDAMMEPIKEKLAKGEEVEFGIVMVDLNNLKQINDQFGHTVGDISLIKLSTIVCGVFTHSPVFRVGGDEFVVLLQNRDYKRIKKLVNEFNVKIEELNEDDELDQLERVSAAIGYALYNPKLDKTVDDVFKRADDAMYKRKHLMKEHSKEAK